ncbi:hypothetical protein DPMN_091833 [Dreissena polymorpha]|uniref:PDZ domain-containing protein n=1 Tax=Dreissena polymorpha TaxID=45954 RepID=A0A9D4L2B3_DREPO|nr:hypothetical protein DPMN_091833 [Dreissena polymorpha]
MRTLVVYPLAQGLGMRVVGGRNSSNGALGAYVTMVTKGGPAATQGISEGNGYCATWIINLVWISICRKVI